MKLIEWIISPPADCKNDTGEIAFYNEDGCFVKHDEQLPWFSARNKCLSRHGELASFSNISLLDDVIDAKPYWVGLRHSHWMWTTEGRHTFIYYAIDEMGL